LARKRIC